MTPVDELEGDGGEGVDGREGELEAVLIAVRAQTAARGYGEVAGGVAGLGVGDAEAEDAVVRTAKEGVLT